MKAFHKKRLLKLADYLEKVPRKEFNMGYWCKTTSCGTVACALGHACMMPEFRRAGLFLSGTEDSYMRTPCYRDFYSLEVAEEFFGLTNEESIRLFVPREDWDFDTEPRFRETPKQVAKRIRTLVKESP